MPASRAGAETSVQRSFPADNGAPEAPGGLQGEQGSGSPQAASRAPTLGRRPRDLPVPTRRGHVW